MSENVEPGGGEYEDPDGQMNYELMQHSSESEDECSGSKQAAAVYITAEGSSR